MNPKSSFFPVLMRVILFLAIGLASFATIGSTQADRPTINVGLVVDTNGLSDNAINQMAYQGLLSAQTDFGITPHTYVALTGEDYEDMLETCVTDGNDLCIGVGFFFSDPIQVVAGDNPTIEFAIIDFSLPDPIPSNLRSVLFDEKEVGYLAGALAGKMTQTDIVGDVGGMDIPPVTRFMDGYKNGAECANNNVIVLKAFAGEFGNQDLGASIAAELLAEGADVVFNVAGAYPGTTGAGVVLYTAQHNRFALGVDVDQYVNTFGNGTVGGSDNLLTSAMKRYDIAVYNTVEDYVNLGGGTWSGTFTYGLPDVGVGLAPYHETDSIIPQSVKDYIDLLKSQIISGAISVDDTCTLLTPTAYVGMAIDADSLADDPGWNGQAYVGMVAAHADFGIYPSVYGGSGTPAEKVADCIADGNALCIGTGFLFSDPMTIAAPAFPAVKFAVLDSGFSSPPTNLRGVQFKAKEAAYLAGVLAAWKTNTNNIGVVGGMQIPPVVDLVEGYVNGAQCTSAYELVMAVYTGTFTDPDLGAQTAKNMIDAGADVIFGAAGPTGNGAILYSSQHDKWSIGVDVDQYLTVFDNGNVAGSDMLLTSAMKRLDSATYDTIEAFLQPGTFGGNYAYGLLEKGVGLAPFHETDDDISDTVKAYLADIEAKIINGTISVDTTCFAPGGFSKTSPAYGALNRPKNLTLKWAAAANTAYYEYCIDKSNDNKCGTGWKSVGSSTSKYLLGLAAGKYYWQVRANNNRTSTIANSGTWWSFTVPPAPGAFNKTFPLNGAVKVPIATTLKWSASSNAAKYEYCIDTINNGKCDGTWKSVNLNLKVNLTGLLKNKKYYWQVRAINANGTTYANASVWWNFTTLK